MNNDKSLLQYFLLTTALKEENIDVNLCDIKIDHKNGFNYINGKSFLVKYPKSYLERINLIQVDKEYECCFIGKIGKLGRKNILEKFKNRSNYIKESNYGRDSKTKYNFDTSYYTVLKKTYYSLCPNHKGKWYQHDNAWTYRFIETLFSKSIPIIFSKTPLGINFTEKFYFFENDIPNISLDEYNSMIIHNYNLAIDKFLFSKNEIEIIQNTCNTRK
jgi:hypothetical protein